MPRRWPARPMRRAMARSDPPGMHSEFVDGLVLRPMMDAGYTAWQGGERLGLARLEGDEIVVDAHDPFVERVLRERLEADLRAAGITLRGCGSSSQAPRARLGARSAG